MSDSSVIGMSSKTMALKSEEGGCAINNLSPTDARRFFMWFCAASFYCVQFILRSSPTVIATDLMQSLALDSLSVAVLVSWYYHGYSAMQIPAGILLDRIGPRRPLSVACLLCLMGSSIFAFSESLITLSLGRLMMGIGSAFGFISCVKIASQAFKRQHLSMYISLTMLMGTLGATAAGKPFALMVDYFDWRNVHFLLAGFILILGLAIWLILPNGNNFSGQHSSEEGDFPAEAILISIKIILKTPSTWLFGIFGFMMYVPLSGVADLWGVPYLMEVYGVDRQMASAANSTIYIGLGLGGPIWSLYVARVKSYKNVLMVGTACTLVFLLALLFVPNLPFSWCSVLFFLIGAAATSQFIAFAGVTELNASHRTGLASGIHNMLCMLSGVIMQPLLGYILKSVWDGTYKGDVPHYTTANFQAALMTLPVCVVIAGLCLLYVKECYPQDES